MVHHKLYYFKATGLAEPIRYLLHYCGIEFEDLRFPFEEWVVKYKKEMPMGRVPVLEIDGKKYHQHKAICRYFARKFNLYGSNEEESLQIDISVDDIEELRSTIGLYYLEEDPTYKATLKEKALEKRSIFLNKFESRVIDNNGFFVNGKVSFADIYYASLCEVMTNILEEDINKDYQNLTKLVENIRNQEGIKLYIETRPLTEV